MGWSRRIDEGQPLVCRLDGELHVILACRYHGRWGARRARPGGHRFACNRAIGRRLRDCDLEIALREARADLGGGRVVHESVDDHLKHLDAWASAQLP